MNHSKWNVKLKIIWNYFLACLIAVIVMIPFLWMLSTSLKSKGALMQIPIEWIPQNPTLDSYRMVFSRFPFSRAILNSFFITCSYTVVTICQHLWQHLHLRRYNFRMEIQYLNYIWHP